MEVDRELWEVTARGQIECLLVSCASLWTWRAGLSAKPAQGCEVGSDVCRERHQLLLRTLGMRGRSYYMFVLSSRSHS